MEVAVLVPVVIIIFETVGERGSGAVRRRGGFTRAPNLGVSGARASISDAMFLFEDHIRLLRSVVP